MAKHFTDRARCRRCFKRVGSANLINGLCKACHREVYGY